MDEQQLDTNDPLVIDVTIPVQSLVKESQLHLHPHSKVWVCCAVRAQTGVLIWGLGHNCVILRGSADKA